MLIRYYRRVVITFIHAIVLYSVLVFDPVFIVSSVSAANVPQNQTKPGLKVGENDDKLILSKVNDNVYAIVGPLGNRSPKNYGNNATFGMVVTQDGIVLIDSGGTYIGAKRIHDVIKTVSDQPIKYVINTGGQDHRWLGNGYFKKLGAKIIASQSAVRDQKTRLTDILFRLSNTAGDAAMEGTRETYADITFDQLYEFSLGKIKFIVQHPSGAHSPGDAFVWVPKYSVLFSGDIIYAERMLSVMSFSNTKSWLNAYNVALGYHPKTIIPGHGRPTTPEIAHRDTFGYLTLMRTRVSEFMESGGGIEDVGKIDQSEYQYLENFEQLKGRNIQQVYQELEWE